MPKGPLGQNHETPARGDNHGAIMRAAKPGGHFALDGNCTIMCGLIWLAHWPWPGRNGYTLVVDANTGHVRPMTRAERLRPGNLWGVEGIRRWRRPNGEAPITYEEGVALAVAHGAVIIGELKSRGFARQVYADQIVAIAKKHDHPAWFKSLYDMKFPGAKCRAIRHAGGQFALIFGTHVKGRRARLRVGRRTTKKWAVQPNATW